MKTTLILSIISALLIACSTDDLDDPMSVEQLYGEYTLSILVQSFIEDAGGPDDRFIPVERTNVYSFPYVTGKLSLTAETMSYDVNTTLPGGATTDLIVINFEASIVIVPNPPENPGEFSMHATYDTELGSGAFSRGITWDGNLLKMDHSQTGDAAQYTLYWHKQ